MTDEFAPAHGRHLSENSTSHVLSVLAVGYRSGAPSAQLGCRLRGIGRFWHLVFWPRRQGRANDVGNFWRQLSRLHGADRSGLSVDTLKQVPIDLWYREIDLEPKPQFSCHFRNILQKTAVGTADFSVYSLPSWRACGYFYARQVDSKTYPNNGERFQC